MTVWAIVPVKPLNRAKSRLSEVLSSEERVCLIRRMFMHTLEVLSQVDNIECTLVVSKDSNVLTLARDYNARTIIEHGSPQLNRALDQATQMAREYDASSVLILPADLPLLTREMVEDLLSLSANPPVVVIVPDRHGTGTNALLMSPPGLIEYEFGPQSFRYHVAHAEAASARVEICDLPSLGLDIDLPEDLEILEVKCLNTPMLKSEE